MIKGSKRTGPGLVWGWQKWIAPADADEWSERLGEVSGVTPTITERPGWTRLLLAAYFENKSKATALLDPFGGQVRSVAPGEWLNLAPTPPLKVGRKFQIIAEPLSGKGKPALPSLLIPHGLAFGSGEHATTAMLVRALARHDLTGKTVLDLGTGSGLLALAARLLGAKKIIGTDFDVEAVRTAKQNEALNFSSPLISWRQADVKRHKGTVRHDLVLANLFSGILIEAAPQIAASVHPGGQLWLSGILRIQEKAVTAAYRKQKLRLLHAAHKGKWVMLQWQRR